MVPNLENYTPSKVFGRFRPETLLAIAVASICLALGIFNAFHHEMWRDETEAWLIARDTPLTELSARLHYVGHPCIWFLILKPFATSGCPVQTMQAVHLGIACTTIFLIVRFAPFPYLYRILFCFGYFPLFEYNVICRNYAVSLLLIVVALVRWKSRRVKPLWLGLVLALMAHATSHGMVVAVAFLVTWGIDTLRRWPHDRQQLRLIAAGMLLATAGIFATYLQLQPPADSFWFSRFNLDLNEARLRMTLNNFIHAVVPLPRRVQMFWNTSAIPESTGAALAAAAIIFIVALALADDLASSLFYLCGTGGLLFLAYAVYPGFLRHHGFCYIVLVGALWLRQSRRPLLAQTHRTSSTTVARWVVALALPPVLVVHVLAAAQCLAADTKYVFSPARDAAEYLRKHQLQGSQFAGSEDVVASTVAAYLPAERVLYMEGDRWGSAVIWDQKRFNGAEGDKMIARLKRRSSEGTEWVLILNYALSEDLLQRHHIKPLAQFSGIVDTREALICLYQYRAPTSSHVSQSRYPVTSLPQMSQL